MMTAIKMVFQSGEHLTIYAEDPSVFSDSLLELKPPEIRYLELTDEDVVTPELVEVRFSLKSGAIVLCHLAKTEMPKARYIQEIVDCGPCTTMTYAKIVEQDAGLDARFTAASNVINNLPDLDTRLYLHKEYMKRKQAYVSAVEALVDGVIRRPTE
jgi:hypothetical protein